MPDLTSILTPAALEAGINAVRDFLATLFGSATEEAGLLLGDTVRHYRLRNQIRILLAAQEKLFKAGIKPQSIPLRTLVPLLEGASLETDDYLSDKWAGLLATAASGDDGLCSHPAFVKILGELSPMDATVLDNLAVIGGKADNHEFKAQMKCKYSLSDDGYTHIWRNLFRLGLWGTKRTNDGESIVFIDPFGNHFLKACSGIS